MKSRIGTLLDYFPKHQEFEDFSVPGFIVEEVDDHVEVTHSNPESCFHAFWVKQYARFLFDAGYSVCVFFFGNKKVVYVIERSW